MKVHETDRPWLTSQLKALIARRQKAFSSGNELLYKMLRNKVNRERKRCRSVYYENKVKDLRVSKPRNWWREVKQLCGATRNTGGYLKSVLHSDLRCEETTLAERELPMALGLLSEPPLWIFGKLSTWSTTRH